MESYTYRFLDRPKFLEGCFDWKGRGYQYNGPPPDDVLTSRARTSGNPWLVLASAVEAAKRGEYTSVSLVREWAKDETANPTLVSACLDFIADAGLKSDLEFLAELM